LTSYLTSQTVYPFCPNCSAGTLGHPQLRGYCHQHFRDVVVKHLSDLAFEAERAYFDALLLATHVEQALGLRPAPYSYQELERPLGRTHLRASKTTIVTNQQASLVGEIVIDDLTEDG
jgi:hypothetical protein